MTLVCTVHPKDNMIGLKASETKKCDELFIAVGTKHLPINTFGLSFEDFEGSIMTDDGVESVTYISELDAELKVTPDGLLSLKRVETISNNEIINEQGIVNIKSLDQFSSNVTKVNELIVAVHKSKDKVDYCSIFNALNRVGLTSKIPYVIRTCLEKICWDKFEKSIDYTQTVNEQGNEINFKSTHTVDKLWFTYNEHLKSIIVKVTSDGTEKPFIIKVDSGEKEHIMNFGIPFSLLYDKTMLQNYMNGGLLCIPVDNKFNIIIDRLGFISVNDLLREPHKISTSRSGDILGFKHKAYANTNEAKRDLAYVILTSFNKVKIQHLTNSLNNGLYEFLDNTVNHRLLKEVK